MREASDTVWYAEYVNRNAAESARYYLAAQAVRDLPGRWAQYMHAAAMFTRSAMWGRRQLLQLPCELY